MFIYDFEVKPWFFWLILCLIISICIGLRRYRRFRWDIVEYLSMGKVVTAITLLDAIFCFLLVYGSGKNIQDFFSSAGGTTWSPLMLEVCLVVFIIGVFWAIMLLIVELFGWIKKEMIRRDCEKTKKRIQERRERRNKDQ